MRGIKFAEMVDVKFNVQSRSYSLISENRENPGDD